MEVYPGIKKFVGMCNTYYIEGKQRTLIDAGYLVREPVDLIIITHAHFDHIYYLWELKQMHHCEVACGLREKEAIENLSDRVLAELSDKPLKSVKVDKVLKEGDVVRADPFMFKVLVVPGHTPGSIALFDEERGILFSGDTLFHEGFGRWDLPGGDMEMLIESVVRLRKLPVKLLCPGHG